MAKLMLQDGDGGFAKAARDEACDGYRRLYGGWRGG